MRKIVVYAGTRNLYRIMRTALASLLANNTVDKVYLLIEDDTYPYPLPNNVATINVAHQPYFRETGANYNSRWAYMSMMRCVMAMLLPDEQRALWLDCDTIVDWDISALFECDMHGNLYAAVPETEKSKGGQNYYNTGVLLADLDRLRKEQQEERLIMYLNVTPLEFPDQDAINELSRGRIMPLNSTFNACKFTAPVEAPAIYHFAGLPIFDNDPVYQKYAKGEREQRVLIAVPCMDTMPTPFVEAFINLQKTGHTTYTFVKNTLIYNARNLIARSAVEKGFDRVLWLDSDVVVKPDTLVNLMRDMDTGIDFVSGVYFKRALPTAPVIYNKVWWNVTEGAADAGAENATEIPAELFEVAGAGFGCCMTSARLLKDLVDRVGAPFTPLIGVSEDLSFCLRAAQAGYRLYCDGRIKCGHVGQIEYNEGMWSNAGNIQEG